MGLYSSFHIAQLQCGLAQPLRLGQARKVKVSYITQLQCGLAQPLRLGQARKVKVSYITQLQYGHIAQQENGLAQPLDFKQLVIRYPNSEIYCIFGMFTQFLFFI